MLRRTGRASGGSVSPILRVGEGWLSRRTARRLLLTNSSTAAAPAGPPPTTATSYLSPTRSGKWTQISSQIGLKTRIAIRFHKDVVATDRFWDDYAQTSEIVNHPAVRFLHVFDSS